MEHPGQSRRVILRPVAARKNQACWRHALFIPLLGENPMVKKISLSAALAISILLTTHAHAAAPATGNVATEKSVLELMAVTGAGDLGMQMMNSMIPAFKKMLPDVPDSFWTGFIKEVDPNEMMGLMVPIYQAHFSETEIQQAITFYKSAAGRKFIQEQPQVMRESMAAGQEWGRRLAQRAMDKAEAARKSPQSKASP
jgi:hypothetical protein